MNSYFSFGDWAIILIYLLGIILLLSMANVLGAIWDPVYRSWFVRTSIVLHILGALVLFAVGVRLHGLALGIACAVSNGLLCERPLLLSAGYRITLPGQDRAAYPSVKRSARYRFVSFPNS